MVVIGTFAELFFLFIPPFDVSFLEETVLFVAFDALTRQLSCSSNSNLEAAELPFAARLGP